MDGATSDNLSKAIAVMTAWNSGSDLEHQQFTAATANDMMDAGDGPLDLISGFITLTGWLLTRIDNATGADATATLQDIARRMNLE